MVKTRGQKKAEGDKYTMDAQLEKRIKELREHIAKLEAEKKHGGTRRHSRKYREAPSRKFQIAGRKKTHKRKH
jgi:hypothetical protein